MKIDDSKNEYLQRNERLCEWEQARMTTQAVAFRVIGVNEDSATGQVPIWAPCPLTPEEEAVLARLTDPTLSKPA